MSKAVAEEVGRSGSISGKRSSSFTPPPLHVMAIPLPAQGHINPLMQLCTRLASKGLTVTFVNVDVVHHRLEEANTTTLAAAAIVSSDAESDVHGIRMQSIPITQFDLSQGFRVSLADMVESLAKLARPVEELIERINKEEVYPVSCIISDPLLTTWTQEVADKFNIPQYAFVASSQSSCLIWLYMESLISKGFISVQEAITGFVENKEKEIDDLPGLPPLRLADFPTYIHAVNDTEFMYSFLIREIHNMRKSHGILTNTFYELESPAIDATAQGLVPVFAVGPLLAHARSGTSLWTEDESCLKWLDEQPPASVLYISFGSVTVLSVNQFEEIVAGLEATRQRFLWVFRPDLIDGVFANAPKYIKQKTQDQGFVVSWSPQQLVLSHPAVGGFFTHCGWNSTMESIANGVPMICWPYCGDQMMNCRFIVAVWKIGMELGRGEGGLASREEVEKVVRGVMEGEEGHGLRKRAQRLKEAAERSLMEGGGGTSQNSLEAFHEGLPIKCPSSPIKCPS